MKSQKGAPKIFSRTSSLPWPGIGKSRTSRAASAVRSSSTDRSRGPAPGTRWCRAARHRSPGATARSTTASPGCRRSPRSVSTCSISRPIHPIGRTNRKGRNNALQASPDDPGQPLRDRLERGRPRRVHPELGTLDDFRRLVEACAEHGTGDRARFRHPMLARPSLADAASGMVQAAARRLDPLCREPAEEIRGHRQPGFLRRRTRSPCGRRCATSCCSGSSRACASSASTIRTPSRFRSGNG